MAPILLELSALPRETYQPRFDLGDLGPRGERVVLPQAIHDAGAFDRLTIRPSLAEEKKT